MIVVDGNDGTGKTTLVTSLYNLGYEVCDRGMPSKATLGEPIIANDNETYIILDASLKESKSRLMMAGKDMSEYWHTDESLFYFGNKFREIAEYLKVPLFRFDSKHETLNAVKQYLGIKNQYRLGIPKGRLYDSTILALKKADISIDDSSDRKYNVSCNNQMFDCFILKPRSIPQMIAFGLLDCGFCGKDLIKESGYEDELYVLADLGTQSVDLVVAVSDPEIIVNPPKRALNIATEYPNIAVSWGLKKGIACVPVNSYGSTEAWVPKFCDIAIDVCETGNTIRENNLTIVDKILSSTTVFVCRKDSALKHHSLIRRFNHEF